MDRYDNDQEKMVAMMKVQKKGGMKDSVIVRLLTYHPNGQLASTTDMIRDIRHGKHIAFSPSGIMIEKGKYENDRKSSTWSWYGVDGILDSLRTYDKGMLSGKSVNYSSTGKKIQELTYRDHKYHGKTIHYNEYGKKSLIGEFNNGIPDGKWTWLNIAGKKERIVTYKNGIKTGPVTIWNDQGRKVMKGVYKNDKKNNEWKWYHDKKGLDSLIQFSDDEYMGKYKIWHVNGEKAVEGKYQNGIKTGKWKWYAINGNVDSSIIYLAGTYNGPVEKYYRNGSLRSEMNYLNGQLDGEQNTYFENGEIKSSTTYINGTRTGPFTVWNANGYKRESGTYLNHKLNGINFRWYHHGEYSTITTYDNGEIHGIMRVYSPSGVITKETYYYFGIPFCQMEYYDNDRLKQIQVFKQNESETVAAHIAALYEAQQAGDCQKLYDDSQVRYKTGQYMTALIMLHQVAQMKGCDEELSSRAQYYIGWNYANDQFKPDEARKAYQKVIDNYPEGFKYVEYSKLKLASYLLSDQAEAAYKAGNFTEAIALREEVIQQKRSDKELAAKNQYLAGYIYHKNLNDLDKAQAAYNNVITIHPKSGYATKALNKLNVVFERAYAFKKGKDKGLEKGRTTGISAVQAMLGDYGLFDSSDMENTMASERSDVFKEGKDVVFQKNWNNLGMETTGTKLKSGITTKTERYDSGNLLSEKSMKGNELHGLSWAFHEDHSLQYLSLYIAGKHVFLRYYMLEENEHLDYLFPDSDFQVVVKIEEEEI